MKNIFKSRRFKYGTFATLFVIGFLIAIIIVNIIAGELVKRFPLSVDLTQNKVFELSDESISFLKNLEQEVEVTVMTTKEQYTTSGGYYAQAVAVLEKYPQYSSKVSVKFVDLLKDPSYTTQYPDLQLNTSSILVKSGTKTKKVSVQDLFNIETDQYYGGQTIASSKAEQTLTSAIIGVTNNGEAPKVVLTTGHEETVSAGLASILSANNFEVKEQKLLTEELDNTANIIVMNGPMRDYTADEIKKLDTFLDNGGKLDKTLIYLASSDAPALPNLEAFLKEWGINVGTGVVYETDSAKLATAQNPFFTMVNYTSEDYAAGLAGRNLFVTVPYGKPLTKAYDSLRNITADEILGYGDTSYVYPADADENYKPSTNDVKGPFSAAIRAKKLAYEGSTPHASYVFAFASSLAIDENVTTSTVFSNGQYISALLNEITGTKSSIAIVPKTIGSGSLNINGAQVITIGITFMIVIPLAVLIAGIVIWLKRRNK